MLPGPGGFTAVALGLSVVVIPKPHRCGQLWNRADEPEITGPFRGAGLAGDLVIVQLGRDAGPTGDHPLQHPVHSIRHVAVESPASAISIHPSAPQHLVFWSADLLKRRGFHEHTPVGHGGIGRGHLQHGLLIGPDRHRVVLAKGPARADVKPVGNFDDGVEPHLVLQLYSHGVERVFEGVGKRHPPEVFVAEVFGAVPPPAAGLINKDVFGFNAAIQRSGIREELEGGAR